MTKLKPCPFCGKSDWLDSGYVNTPDAYWDSGMRGEQYYYVQCFGCGVIMKNDNEKELIKTWNERGGYEEMK